MICFVGFWKMLIMIFAGMLDHIIVETGGVKVPLSHLALVSVLDPKTLSVNPYDPDVTTNLPFFLFFFSGLN